MVKYLNTGIQIIVACWNQISKIRHPRNCMPSTWQIDIGESITINNFVIDIMIIIVFVYFYIFILIVWQCKYCFLNHLFLMQSVGDHVGVQLWVSNLNFCNWDSVIEYICYLHCNYARFNGFLLNVFYDFWNFVKTHNWPCVSHWLDFEII